jgi:hypothetical protein
MRGADYCYVHSFGRLRGVPFWKNWMFHAIVLTVLGIAYANYFGPTKENQEQILTKQDEQSNKTDDILEILNTMCTTEQSRLLREYRFGYALFAVDRKHVITPCPNPPILHGYRIDWSQARVLDITPTEIWLSTPNIYFRNSRVVSGKMGLSRNGAETRHVAFFDVGVVGRMLFQTRQGFICVIGLKETERQTKN